MKIDSEIAHIALPLTTFYDEPEGSQGSAHEQGWPETGLSRSAQPKTAGTIEILGVRIADDMEKSKSLRAGYLAAVLD